MALTAGTILGQYEIRSPLGASGMGEVYRAHDSRRDRDVAIKILGQYIGRESDGTLKLLAALLGSNTSPERGVNGAFATSRSN